MRKVSTESNWFWSKGKRTSSKTKSRLISSQSKSWRSLRSYFRSCRMSGV
jgi:hypothetical protein